MRLKNHQIHERINGNLKIEFAEQQVSSYSGLELFKRYFRIIRLNDQIRQAFKAHDFCGDYAVANYILVFIALWRAGGRRLRHVEFLAPLTVLTAFTVMSLSSASFAQCTHPELLKSIKEMTEAAQPAQAGQKAAPPLNASRVLDYGPSGENIGPEVIGPYTLAEAVSAYMQDMRDNGYMITQKVANQNTLLLTRTCEQVQIQLKNGVKVPDTVEIIKHLQSKHKSL